MGILQAKILEWVAIPFSKDLPNPGTDPGSPALQADSSPTELQGKPKKPQTNFTYKHGSKNKHNISKQSISQLE